jgi:cobalt-zinc-cadmium efflux system protein
MDTDGSRDQEPSHDHDHAGHSHGPSRGEELAAVSDGRLLWAVVLNQFLTLVEVIAGVISGSVALLSDAAHNFNDANALLIAYVARRISRKQADERYTFGYRRAEMIGALINLTLLAVIGTYLVYEGVRRLWAPEPITGWLMAAAAVVALVVDVATALLLWAMSRGSLNVRAAFLHNIVDALGSIAVLVGAGAIIWFGWTWVDPLITLMIAAYVLWETVKMFPQATSVLMESAPSDLDLERLVASVESLDRVDSLHHLHVWQLDEKHRALEAHVVMSRVDVDRFEQTKQEIKLHLEEQFGIGHSTLEFEWSDESANPCSPCSIAPSR